MYQFEHSKITSTQTTPHNDEKLPEEQGAQARPHDPGFPVDVDPDPEPEKSGLRSR